MNGGKNILLGVHFGLLLLKKLETEMAKALERIHGINWHFIYENNGK